MLKKVLIANRGVVAMRIARTLRRLGVPYAVVHSEADGGLPYVREATEAMHIGEARPQLSYLIPGAILEAAHRTGCDAIHPGYGFLSESVGFARKVVDAGFTFIGPEPQHIAALGDKARAREVMVEAGFPVLPASAPLPEQGDAEAEAKAIGYPLLIKASAGGGGVGMQRVDRPDQLANALAKARGFAERFFGNRTVFLEHWLTEARHVEFQIIADGMGDALSLHHRDCSVQRRHQKVIEEAPAPFIDEGAAHNLGVRLAAFFGRFGYRNLATVEMLMDRDGRFYFLGVNTRLQVEHGVTELITGLDLVEIQLRLANGERLGDILPHGARAGRPRDRGPDLRGRLRQVLAVSRRAPCLSSAVRPPRPFHGCRLRGGRHRHAVLRSHARSRDRSRTRPERGHCKARRRASGFRGRRRQDEHPVPAKHAGLRGL